MDQDKLKTLLKIIINKTESDQLTSIEEIISIMKQEFQHIGLATKDAL